MPASLRPRLPCLAGIGIGAAVLVVVWLAAPAVAQAADPTLGQVIDRLRNVVVGLLVGLATLFLTVGGLRYLFAGGDPGQVEKAKVTLRSAAIGYGLAALNAALDGVVGTTAVHLCFGYAAIIHERPSGYSFLTELAGASCDQISIETAQSKLDCAVLEGLPGKTIILGVIDLDDQAVETPETVAERIRRALPYKGAGELVAAPDCGMKYLLRDAAFGKLQSLVEGARLVREGDSP